MEGSSSKPQKPLPIPMDPIQWPGNPRRLRRVDLNRPDGLKTKFKLPPEHRDPNYPTNPVFICEECGKTKRLEKLNHFLATKAFCTVCERCFEKSDPRDLLRKYLKRAIKMGVISLTKTHLKEL